MNDAEIAAKSPIKWWDEKPIMLNEVFGFITKEQYARRKKEVLRILSIWERNSSQAMADPYRIMVMVKEVFCGER